MKCEIKLIKNLKSNNHNNNNNSTINNMENNTLEDAFSIYPFPFSYPENLILNGNTLVQLPSKTIQIIMSLNTLIIYRKLCAVRTRRRTRTPHRAKSYKRYDSLFC